MRTREIPRDEWTRFFDNLSRRQEGWEVTLEVFGPDIGDQVEERHMFLAGVTAEVADEGDKIEIMVGGKPSGHVTHMITAPDPGRAPANRPWRRLHATDQVC